MLVRGSKSSTSSKWQPKLTKLWLKRAYVNPCQRVYGGLNLKGAMPQTRVMLRGTPNMHS